MALGWANRSFPADQLDDAVLNMAPRVAGLSLAGSTSAWCTARPTSWACARPSGQVRGSQALAGHQRSVEAFKADPLGTMKRVNAADAARPAAREGRGPARLVTSAELTAQGTGSPSPAP